MYNSPLSLTSALDWMGGQRHATDVPPPERTRYPLCRRLVGAQGLSERVRKISPPPEFDPRTVHTIAIRYTDYVIPSHSENNNNNNNNNNMSS
jgi:hypothetical protein